MTKIEIIQSNIADAKNKYKLRNAHIAKLEPEAKANFLRGRVPQSVYTTALKDIEAYKKKTMDEFSQVKVMEQELSEAIDAAK